MKLANKEIEDYLYTTIGASFSAGGTTWEYYTNPPKTPTNNRYAWAAIDMTNEDGTKDDFIGIYLLELTLVDRTNSNFTDNNAINQAGTYLGNLLDVRGRQVTLPSFNLISVRLVGQDSGLEHEAQQTILVRKLIFSILAEEL